MTVSFEELVKEPPLKRTPFTLPDERVVTLYELPVLVMEEVQAIGREEAEQVSSVMESITRVAAFALLGRAPDASEMDTIKGFGTTTVMAIYYKALTFSRLGADALEETKKH